MNALVLAPAIGRRLEEFSRKVYVLSWLVVSTDEPRMWAKKNIGLQLTPGGWGGFGGSNHLLRIWLEPYRDKSVSSIKPRLQVEHRFMSEN